MHALFNIVKEGLSFHEGDFNISFPYVCACAQVFMCLHVQVCILACACTSTFKPLCECECVCVYTTQLHLERFPAYSNQDGTTYLGQVQGSCGGTRTGWLE